MKNLKSNNKIDFEKYLNNEQLEIVNNLNGKMLVLAGAGSGKTRTISFSVAKLIEMGIPPHEIMLVTFTNKAADEMLSRVKELLGYTPNITSGTFHSIANNIFIRKFGKLLDYNNYEIMDNQKSIDLVRKCIDNACFNELHSNPKYANLNQEDKDKKFKHIKQSKYPKARIVRSVISYSKNCNCSIEDALMWKFEGFIKYCEKTHDINKRYENIKIKHNKLDFDDVLTLWNILLNFRDVQDYAKRYKFILVDEYQDTNFIQNEIIIKLSNLNQDSCLMVVGDDAQSIYKFRGANFKNFIRFQENDVDCRKYDITINYRSSPEILDLANDSIKHNKNQFKKYMKTSNSSGSMPLHVNAENEEQVDWIIDKINSFIESGTPYNEIALLFRALRGYNDEIYNINKLMLKMVENDIPFEVRGGRSLFEKAHVRDILAFLGFRYRPKGIFSEIYWDRIAKKYIYGLGKTNSQKIYVNIIAKHKNPLEVLISRQSLKSEIQSLKSMKIISRIGEKTINTISSIINKWISYHGTVGDIIQSFLDDDEFFGILKSLYKKNEIDDSFEERLNDLNLLVEFGKKFKTIGNFLNSLSLNQSEFNEDKSKKKENEKVVISTIHRAKGLEWNNVFLPMLNYGHFPSFKNMKIIEELEEERRIFYVAITRCKQNLFLLSSRNPSLFIQEIDKSLYRKKTIY